MRGCCGCLGLCIEACDVGRGLGRSVCVMLSPLLCDIVSVSLGCHCGSCGWRTVWCGCGAVRVSGGMGWVGRGVQAEGAHCGTRVGYRLTAALAASRPVASRCTRSADQQVRVTLQSLGPRASSATG